MSRAAAIRSSASAKASAHTPQAAIDRFYCDNFIDLMGAGLAEDLRRPAHILAAA